MTTLRDILRDLIVDIEKQAGLERDDSFEEIWLDEYIERIKKQLID